MSLKTTIGSTNIKINSNSKIADDKDKDDLIQPNLNQVRSEKTVGSSTINDNGLTDTSNILGEKKLTLEPARDDVKVLYTDVQRSSLRASEAYLGAMKEIEKEINAIKPSINWEDENDHETSGRENELYNIQKRETNEDSGDSNDANSRQEVIYTIDLNPEESSSSKYEDFIEPDGQKEKQLDCERSGWDDIDVPENSVSSLSDLSGKSSKSSMVSDNYSVSEDDVFASILTEIVTSNMTGSQDNLLYYDDIDDNSILSSNQEVVENDFSLSPTKDNSMNNKKESDDLNNEVKIEVEVAETITDNNDSCISIRKLEELQNQKNGDTFSLNELNLSKSEHLDYDGSREYKRDQEIPDSYSVSPKADDIVTNSNKINFEIKLVNDTWKIPDENDNNDNSLGSDKNKKCELIDNKRDHNIGKSNLNQNSIKENVFNYGNDYSNGGSLDKDSLDIKAQKGKVRYMDLSEDNIEEFYKRELHTSANAIAQNIVKGGLAKGGYMGSSISDMEDFYNKELNTNNVKNQNDSNDDDDLWDNQEVEVNSNNIEDWKIFSKVKINQYQKEDRHNIKNEFLIINEKTEIEIKEENFNETQYDISDEVWKPNSRWIIPNFNITVVEDKSVNNQSLLNDIEIGWEDGAMKLSDFPVRSWSSDSNNEDGYNESEELKSRKKDALNKFKEYKAKNKAKKDPTQKFFESEFNDI
ncbi:hypothetical protein K502DRAFT_362838 [Neoconidiobolus thromboides FSU 785]|nr:hypothetical protein K502DRAFT_362838 [Neoconidiobolus thromboides FSU 785]